MDVMESARASYQQKNNSNLDHIPGKYGTPIIANIAQARSNPFKLYDEQYKNYGSLSKITLFTRKGLLALGPDLAKQITLDKEKNFSNYMGYNFALKGLFDGGLLLHDFDDHRFHRRIMQTAFKNPALQGYTEVMNSSAPEFISQWDTEKPFVMFPAIKALTLQIAARIFIGTHIGSDMDKMVTAFGDMLEATIAIIRTNVPGTNFKFTKGVRAKNQLDAYFKSMLPEKRKGSGTDMMTYFSQELDENGQLFTDEAVCQHLRFLMLAAHDTTASALINTFYLLAAYPEWQTKVREEMLSIPSDVLSYDDMSKLPQLENVFMEVVRLYPPAPSVLRRTVRDCEMAGYHVPANTVITLSAVYTHRMKEWWDEPLKFDPDRFAPPREEHKRHAYSWVPFGGGAHKCIGMHFALLLYKSIIFHALRTYQFSLPAGYPMPGPTEEINWSPIPKPKDGLTVIVKPLK